MNRSLVALLLFLPILLFCSCGGGSGSSKQPTIVVNSLADDAAPPAGTVTLRSAMAAIESGGRILFDSTLSGGEILLTIVGEEHSTLVGESFPMGKFAGFTERDYGRSALYARKNLTIDASALPDGLTLTWTGGDANPARVLAVYGDLNLRNIHLRSGVSAGEPIIGGTQGYTLARGAGLAVWGTATLDGCTVSGNRTMGDEEASRDRGSFGGGIYGNRLVLTDCVIAGNSVKGYGAAGGGVYSVSGRDMPGEGSTLSRCSVSGNRVTGQHAYGGGVYTDGGGPGGANAIDFLNCTIARNLVEDNPDLPEVFQWFYRGGGIYMSNGILRIESCTIAENEVTGVWAILRDRPNMAGGAVAATIGDAHVVDRMEIAHSILVGNTVNGGADDLYTGSLVHFMSQGYNLFGVFDPSQILVPIPPWQSLCRIHWPEDGDQDNVTAAQVLSLPEAELHGSIVSRGVDAGNNVVLSYPPAGAALDRIPGGVYPVHHTYAEYADPTGAAGGLLNRVLDKLRADHAGVLGTDFGAGFGDMTGVVFDPVPDIWPSEASNEPWITFWHDLDAEIAGRLGTVALGEEFWASLAMETPGGFLVAAEESIWFVRTDRDQRGTGRPAGGLADIGAVER